MQKFDFEKAQYSNVPPLYNYWFDVFHQVLKPMLLEYIKSFDLREIPFSSLHQNRDSLKIPENAIKID